MFLKIKDWKILALFVAAALGLVAETYADTLTPSANAAASTSAQNQPVEAAPGWMIGKFTPARTLFGSDPDEYCLLIVTPKQLIFTEKPGGRKRVLSYRILVSQSDFIIVSAVDDRNSQDVCMQGPMTAVRFDHKDYVNCIGHNGPPDEVAEKACPEPFTMPHPEDFDLTVYADLDAALHIPRSERTEGALRYWSGYWRRQQ